MTFEDALSAHLDALSAKGNPFARVVNAPTRPTGAVRSELLEATGAAPEELIAWFSWQDGISEDGDLAKPAPSMFGGYVPFGLVASMQRAGRIRQALRIPVGLPNPWVPVAGEWARTLIVNADTGRVFLFFDGEQTEEIADSLTSLLRAWTEFLESEATWDDESGIWRTHTPWAEMNPQQARRIGNSLVAQNPRRR